MKDKVLQIFEKDFEITKYYYKTSLGLRKIDKSYTNKQIYFWSFELITKSDELWNKNELKIKIMSLKMKKFFIERNEPDNTCEKQINKTNDKQLT